MKIKPWTPDIEGEYHQFIQDGSAAEFFPKINSGGEEEGEDDEEEWTDAQEEAYLHNQMNGF